MTDEYFAKGMDVSTYLGKLRNYPSVVKKLMKEAEAKAEHVEELRNAAARYEQPVRATASTEDWCGDWACNLPILSDLFGRSGIEFRIFRGSEHQRLKERYRRDGDTHIPVISLWDGGGNEIARWIEAPAKVAEMKDQWKRENPELMELYEKQKEDKEAAKRFASLYRQFLLTMAEWYKDGMWEETTKEILRSGLNPAIRNSPTRRER
jgi:hypothetical protein